MEFRTNRRKSLVTAVLYIEGGGDNRRLGTQFREGWASFFRRAEFRGRMPKVVRGGTRQQTFNRFITALGDSKGGTVPILLVDSEGPVTTTHSVWQHLHTRDRWDKPASAGNDQAFLMVQVMETWFLADRNALQTYFGERFTANAIRQWPQLEKVSKKNGSRCTSDGYRTLLQTLCQRENRLPIARANRPGSRRKCLPSRKESAGPTQRFSITIPSPY